MALAAARIADNAILAANLREYADLLEQQEELRLFVHDLASRRPRRAGSTSRPYR